MEHNYLNVDTSVAVLLQRERNSVMREWLRRVNLVPELARVTLSDAERTHHLPKLFDELIHRLRIGRSTPPIASIAAKSHAKVRFAQGYSVCMLVEESRIFQVSTFGMLHRCSDELNQSQLMLDVITIADEADKQLGEALQGFTTVRAAA